MAKHAAGPSGINGGISKLVSGHSLEQVYRASSTSSSARARGRARNGQEPSVVSGHLHGVDAQPACRPARPARRGDPVFGAEDEGAVDLGPAHEWVGVAQRIGVLRQEGGDGGLGYARRAVAEERLAGDVGWPRCPAVWDHDLPRQVPGAPGRHEHVEVDGGPLLGQAAAAGFRERGAHKDEKRHRPPQRDDRNEHGRSRSGTAPERADVASARRAVVPPGRPSRNRATSTASRTANAYARGTPVETGAVEWLARDDEAPVPCRDRGLRVEVWAISYPSRSPLQTDLCWCSSR